VSAPPAPATTIDRFVAARNLSLGFIRADVEGAALQAVRGAIKTLRSQRPIVAIAGYHGVEKFFGAPTFPMQQLPNHYFEWQMGNPHDAPDTLFELDFFAYPNEAAPPPPEGSECTTCTGRGTRLFDEIAAVVTEDGFLMRSRGKSPRAAAGGNGTAAFAAASPPRLKPVSEK
jgi:hypothetical protein